jgi:hypothetical protein
LSELSGETVIVITISEPHCGHTSLLTDFSDQMSLLLMLVAVLSGDHKSLELTCDLESYHGAEDTDDEENDEDVEDRHKVELEGVREYTQQSLFLVFADISYHTLENEAKTPEG